MSTRRALFNCLVTAMYLAGLPIAGLAQQDTTCGQTPPSGDCPAPNPHSDADSNALRIGVRQHARPFSYHSDDLREVWSASPQAPLARNKYTGYMSKICDAVIADMLLNPAPLDPEFSRHDIQVVDVDELSRNDPNPRDSRLEYLGDKIDILCDPATITNERRHGFILSPPLFLSGIGLINLRSNPVGGRGLCPAKTLIGYVGNTNAALAGIPRLLEANEFKSYTDLLRVYVNSQKSTCASALGSTKVVQDYPDHEQAAKAFCAGEFYYYIGDREIITYNARNIPGCSAEIEGAGQTYSNDRYAIYGKFNHSEGHELRDLRIARFFEILSQKVVVSPSVLDSAYENTFYEQPSRKLEAFYWNIRGPRGP